MNGPEMLRILDSIARDRKVERSVLIADLEQAMVSAARKHFGSLDMEEFACSVDQLSGEISLTRHGEPVELNPQDLGRIAAQTFKQVMIQKFREDEQTSLYDRYHTRIGQILTGTAQRYERGGRLVVSLDAGEGEMPRQEQIPGEQFSPGDRVRAMILDVKRDGSATRVVLSRAHTDFIKRLFEVEVPEVAERIIEIKAMAREPGQRTKLAVSSIDSRVDAVGACVGVRGSRIKNIVDELNGEKIDIVRWNESSQILIQNALKPAEVAEISLCFELGRATVVVRDDQLSLAIGKRGQNVRLAAKLTGWDVDILTPEEFTKNLEILSTTLQQIEGVDEQMVDRLAALGMISVFDVEEIGAEVIAAELELSPEMAEKAVQLASEQAKIVAEQQAREKEEAEKRRAEEQARIAAGDDLLGPEGAPDADSAAAAILGGGAAPATDGQTASQAAGQTDGGGDSSSESQGESAQSEADGEGNESDKSNGDSRAAEILGG
ncbi:MAG: transcription termination factor NusA [Phycisphaerales bacterium JB064]